MIGVQDCMVRLVPGNQSFILIPGSDAEMNFVDGDAVRLEAILSASGGGEEFFHEGQGNLKNR